MSEQRIHLRVRLPHSPSTVFAALAHHEGLVNWVGAHKVEVRERTSDGGVGTVRRVHFALPGGVKTRLDERIERFEPPHRLGYRARPGLLFRRYEAEMRVPATPDGCMLEWTIRLRTWLPGTGPAVALQFERALRAGLRRLEAMLGPGPGVPRTGPLLRALDAEPEGGPAAAVTYRELVAACQQAQAELTARALRLGADGSAEDTRYWLLRVLALATAHTLDRVEAGCFRFPCWVLRVSVATLRHLQRNLQQADRPDGTPESHWQSWLRATANASRWWATDVRAAAHSLTKGTYNHFLEDSPRALAEVFAQHYRRPGGPPYSAFADDWRAMLPAYDQAWALVRPEFQLLISPLEQLHGLLSSERAKELLLQDPLVGVQVLRDRAWHRGSRLLALIEDLEA